MRRSVWPRAASIASVAHRFTLGRVERGFDQRDGHQRVGPIGHQHDRETAGDLERARHAQLLILPDGRVRACRTAHFHGYWRVQARTLGRHGPPKYGWIRSFQRSCDFRILSIVSRIAPPPPGASGNVVGGVAGLGAGVGHGDAQAGPTQGQHVRQIVAHVTNLLRPQVEFLANLLHRGQLVGDALADDLDSQFGRPGADDVRAAQRHQAERMARLVPQPDAHPVADVKLLRLDALIVVRHAAVGQHAVDVGENQLDRLAPLVHIHDRLPAGDWSLSASGRSWPQERRPNGLLHALRDSRVQIATVPQPPSTPPTPLRFAVNVAFRPIGGLVALLGQVSRPRR